MTTTDLHSRLQRLSDSTKSTSQLITNLSKLAPTTSAEDTAKERVDQSADIHQSLKDLEEELEILKQETEDYASTGNRVAGRRRDSEKEGQRVQITTQVERLGEDLKLCRSQFRRAQLSAKRAEEAFKRREREQLFSNLQDSDGHPRGHGKKRNQEKLSQDELAVNASQDVTAALRRTHQLMQSEYERSEFARETLRNSTDALNSLSESYSSLDTLLAASRGFIRTLVTSQKSDTWYLETTVKLLIALVIWLVFRRIFWGPITWFVLWPSKLVFKLLFSVLHVAASIFGGGQSVDSTAAVSSHSRPPLKIQPSASNRAPPMQAGGDARMRTGAGGSKDRKRLHNENPDTLSEQVGKMVENTQNQEKGGIRKEEKEELHDMEMNEHKEGEEGGGELKDEDKHDTTGDGTKLKARGPDEKPNPKKRMFEDPPEKQRERDEL